MANRSRGRSTSQRAQALLAEQRRRERARNLLVVGAVVLALVLVGGVMIHLQTTRDTSGRTATVVPKHLTGPYDVVVGRPSAPTTITAYEDLQCPICREFEAVTGARTQAAIAAGRVKVDYHLVAFLDSMSSTDYSSRALNAAMAVLSTAGPDAFMRFRTIAFDHQPPENSAGVPDATLVDWAVQAGARESEVTPLIDGDVYHQWVVNATDQMSKDGVTATPTILVDGQNAGDPTTAAQKVLQAVR
jgi:protein-disulfide isomerase